jgi:hypothetical protein
MNKMTGIIIMVLGALIFSVGAFVFQTKQKPEIRVNYEEQMSHLIDVAVADGVLTNREVQKIIALANESNMDATDLINEARSRIEKSEEDSETEIIDHIKKSGDDFEKFVVKKFSQKYYNVVEWAGDKYIDGIYADTTLHPDLLMELQLKSGNELFYVECKWRKGFDGDKVQFARMDQLERYKKFEKEKNIPVFITLGIGGKAGNPEAMYNLPVRFINSNSITREELKKYEKDISKDFYYVAKANLLR